MQKEVSKSGLAKAIGRSPAVITRMVKSGIFDGCYAKNGKIILHKALVSIKDNKGEEYLLKSSKNFNQLNQLEVIELIETEKNITFERPKKDDIRISLKKLKSGDFHSWIPKAIVSIENVKVHLKNSFTNEEIKASIEEVNSIDKYYSLNGDCSKICVNRVK